MTTFGKIIIFVLLATFVVAAAWAWQYYQIQNRPRSISIETLATTTDRGSNTLSTTTKEIYETAIAYKTDLFKTVSVISGELLQVGTEVRGEVRGNWYFEASFPVELRTGTSTVVWSGIAQAQSDWMTTDFVPFKVNINYTAFGTTTPALLVLKKDNLSGEPAYDDELHIPVLLQ
jgi:hypothetical protein